MPEIYSPLAFIKKKKKVGSCAPRATHWLRHWDWVMGIGRLRKINLTSITDRPGLNSSGAWGYMVVSGLLFHGSQWPIIPCCYDFTVAVTESTYFFACAERTNLHCFRLFLCTTFNKIFLYSECFKRNKNRK